MPIMRPRRPPDVPEVPEAPDVPEVFRSAVCDVDALDATINRWCADGFCDLDWSWMDPNPITSTDRLFVWAWRHDDAPDGADD